MKQKEKIKGNVESDFIYKFFSLFLLPVKSGRYAGKGGVFK